MRSRRNSKYLDFALFYGDFETLTPSFFQMCHRKLSPSAQPNSNNAPPSPDLTNAKNSPNAGTTELIAAATAAANADPDAKEETVVCDYSWRNFFSSINFLKILQKMVKHRSHRTWMMNQYKSSVYPFNITTESLS